MNGIVLAGGENKRMGADKAFLTLAGIPLIAHVLRALAAVCKDIIVVTNSPQRYAQFDARVVTDVFDKRGPLTGICSGLRHSSDQYNFVAACDMPFLNAGLISFMAGLCEGYDIVVPIVEGRVEPLHAIYNKSVMRVIEDHLMQDRRTVRDLFTDLRVRYVTAQEIERFDPTRRSFKNLNTPKEYEEATCAD